MGGGAKEGMREKERRGRKEEKRKERKEGRVD